MEKHNLIFCLLLIIFGVECTVKTLLIQRQLSNTRVMSGETSKTVMTHSVSQCSMMCSAASTCQAFNYQKGSSPNICEMLETQLNKSDDQQSIYSGVDYDYYEVNYCYNRNPCLNGGTCVKPSEVAFGLTCRCTEQFNGPICETEITNNDNPPANDETIVIDDGMATPPSPEQELTTTSSETTTVEETTIGETTEKTTIAPNSETVTTKASTSVTKLHTGTPTHYDGPSCNGTTQFFVNTSGTFTSDRFPLNYADNINCTYLISVPGADTITFTINNSSVESSTGCVWDRLSFYAGPSVTNQSLLTVCEDPTINYAFTVNDYTAVVYFSTDHSFNRYGFNVSYVANINPIMQGMANALF